MNEPFLSSTGNEKMTKEVRSREVIIREDKGIDLRLLKKRTSSKTFEGWLIGQMKMASKNENLDMAKSLEFIYKKYKEYKPTNEQLIKIEIIEGWKGQDRIEINYFENDFLIETHNKDKESGEVSTSRHLIKKEDVNRILSYIKKWKISESHKCYDFANVIGEDDWSEVWKKRMDVYFLSK